MEEKGDENPHLHMFRRGNNMTGEEKAELNVIEEKLNEVSGFDEDEE